MAKVIVYSTPTCSYCALAKAFLANNNIEYEDVDVSADREKANEMVIKSGQMGVPVLDIDGKIIVGYNMPAIMKALGMS